MGQIWGFSQFLKNVCNERQVIFFGEEKYF